MNWFARLVNKRRLETELRKELEFHLDQQITDYVAAGFSKQEATRKALLQFGGSARITEQSRDARGTQWCESLLEDIRLSLRGLRNSSGLHLRRCAPLLSGLAQIQLSFNSLMPFACGVCLLPIRSGWH